MCIIDRVIVLYLPEQLSSPQVLIINKVIQFNDVTNTWCAKCLITIYLNNMIDTFITHMNHQRQHFIVYIYIFIFTNYQL